MKYAIQQFVFSADDCVRISPFAQIAITVAGTTDPADLWDDSEGLTPIDGNTVLADETGYFRVYADAGFYDIEILSGSITRTLRDVAVGAGSGGSNFAGDWDMSIGEPGGRADELTIATLSTLTGTTITPDYPLSVTGDYLFTGGETGRIQLADPGPGYAVFALTMPAGACSGVQIRYLVSVLCNSGANAADIEAIFNGAAPSTAVWAVGVMYDISAYPRPQVKTFAVVNSVLDLANPFVGSGFNYGEAWPFSYDYATATLNDYSNESISVVLDTAAITGAGQQLKIIAGGLAESGRTQYGYGSITYGQNGFMLTADAYLPDGAVDGDWYRVTGAGTFAGVDTVIGDYVKLIEGMTDIIAVHYGSDGDQGPQGDPGPAGADGEPGADGAQGDPGADGADGAQGDPGPAGADGASAYDVAVANGFVGNEAAWLASLVGETGPQGDPGPTGATGAAGTNGTNGTAATIAVGTVTTGAAGSSVSITNSGTSSAATFDFTIPRGDTGATGATGANGPLTISNKTGAYTVVSGDLGTVINCTANTFTVSLTAAATIGAGFRCWVWNTSNTSSHVITIDPASTETIDGATTLLIRRGEGFEILCDGTNWQTAGTKKQRLYSENAANNATRPVVSGSNACAFGNASQATATSSVAFGDGAIATGTSAVAIGTSRATTQDSVAIAITDNTTTYGAKTNSSALAMGYLNTASGLYSLVIGGSSSTAGGQSSSVVGGSSGTASGTCSSVIGGTTNSASNSFSSVIGGANNSASAQYSSVIGGTSNSASGLHCAVVGSYGSNATGDHSAAIGGKYLSANVYGKVAFGTGASLAAVRGASQTGITTLVGESTDATPVVLTSSNTTGNTLNQLVLQNYSSMAVTGRIVAQRKGSESTTSTAMWTFNAVIRRGANAASTALVASVTPTLIAADADAAAWTIAVTADTTNGALAITVTGEAAKNIRWVCTLESTETIYA